MSDIWTIIPAADAGGVFDEMVFDPDVFDCGGWAAVTAAGGTWANEAPAGGTWTVEG